MKLFSDGFDGFTVRGPLMNSVTVRKDELLDTLRVNRDKHRQVFLEALDGYKKEVIATLEAKLEEARLGKRIPNHIRIDQPVDQTREYDRAIKMLEMSVDETIDLSAQEFEAYVMDRWHWKQQFLLSNSKYSVTASSMMAQDEGEELA